MSTDTVHDLQEELDIEEAKDGVVGGTQEYVHVALHGCAGERDCVSAVRLVADMNVGVRRG